MKRTAVLALVFTIATYVYSENCTISQTKVFGKSEFCAGDLIFSDEFEFFDFNKWQHENTLAGGGNWEFQWYTNNRSNSYVEDGVLYIKPTLTADHLGEAALTSATLDLNGGAPADYCTNAGFYGCIRTGTKAHLLNPIKSARIRTVESFYFTYGRVQVRAKLPKGDWLWPAIWMMPRHNAYGSWPASGEIDIMESRGNDNLLLKNVNIGNKQVGSTLHWGPDLSYNRYERTHAEKNNSEGFNSDFHVYEMLWTPDYFQFLVDGEQIGNFTPTEGGFWELGNLEETGVANPWKGGSKMAPFDQHFYLLINLAVGGVNGFFPDEAVNSPQKPWVQSSTNAMGDFWKKKDDWLPTWNLTDSDDAALQIDYVRVYAV